MLVYLSYLLAGLAITFVLTRAVGFLVRRVVGDRTAAIWTFAITVILLVIFAYFTVSLRAAIILFAPGMIIWLIYDLMRPGKNAQIR